MAYNTGRRQVWYSPGEYAVHVFGGVKKLARILGMEPTNISRWQRSRHEGGPRGLIPNKKQKVVLDIAKERGLDLTAEDIIYGRQVIED